MSEMIDNLRKFLDSPEGKLSVEKFRKENEARAERKERWTEKIHSLLVSLDQPSLDSLLGRFLEWEKDYEEMWYRRGVETESNLQHYLFETFVNHGKERTLLEEDMDGFLGGCFEMGGWKASIFHGQGSVTHIEKLSEEERKDPFPEKALEMVRKLGVKGALYHIGKMIEELESVEMNYDLESRHPDVCLSKTVIPYYRNLQERIEKLESKGE